MPNRNRPGNRPTNRPQLDPEQTELDIEPTCTVCDEPETDCECMVCDACDVRTRDRDVGCHSHRLCQDCLENTDDHYNCNGCSRCYLMDSTSRSYCSNCSMFSCCREFSCGDCDYCSECCSCEHEEEETRDGYIEDYSSKNYPPQRPHTTPYAPYPWLGAECEVEMKSGYSRSEASEHIYNDYSDRILQKHDGSLDNGIEFVTGKMSLDEHKRLWPDLCTLAVKHGCRAWKRSSTGFHVHINRAFLTPLSIGKLLVFVNSPVTRDSIVKLAGRESPSYAALEKKKLTSNYIGDNSSRFEAVNVTNSRTIEIRIFKGTLNPVRILAYLEFTDAVAHWVSTISMVDAERFDLFLAYCQTQKKRYRHLLQFYKLLPITETAIKNDETEVSTCVS